MFLIWCNMCGFVSLFASPFCAVECESNTLLQDLYPAAETYTYKLDYMDINNAILQLPPFELGLKWR